MHKYHGQCDTWWSTRVVLGINRCDTRWILYSDCFHCCPHKEARDEMGDGGGRMKIRSSAFHGWMTSLSAAAWPSIHYAHSAVRWRLFCMYVQPLAGDHLYTSVDKERQINAFKCKETIKTCSAQARKVVLACPTVPLGTNTRVQSLSRRVTVHHFAKHRSNSQLIIQVTDIPDTLTRWFIHSSMSTVRMHPGKSHLASLTAETLIAR